MKKLMIVLVAIAMVGAFAATTMAAEWSFYGSSRMTTFSYNKSKEVVGTNFDDQDTTWTSQTNARFGANVKASDTVSGRFEQAMSSNSFALRLMYGVWNFGSGSLLVGQDYTPADTIISASVGVLPSVITAAGQGPALDGEGNGLQIGSFYESRIAQIKLKFGDFQLAFIQPSTQTYALREVDTTLPKIEVAYKFKTDAFYVQPYAGYQTVDYTLVATDSSESVVSYLYGAQFGINFGPMYVKGNVFGSQNSGNYGRSNVTNFDSATISATNVVSDATTYGGIILAGFKLNDMLTFEAGYAMDKSKLEVPGTSDSENDPSHYYVNATITLAPGVFIVPEFGVFNFGDNEVAGVSTDQGDVTYFGAKWQINF